METVSRQSIADARLVLTGSGGTLHYDYLVIATGARHAYFGHDEWEKAAPGLKTIGDATRDPQPHPRRLRAGGGRPSDEALRQALLTFVIVGGGPTGVELAGAIVELARKAIWPATSAASTLRRPGSCSSRRAIACCRPSRKGCRNRRNAAREALGVEVWLGAAVTRCDADGVDLADGRSIASRCVLWAAGVMASRGRSMAGRCGGPRRAGRSSAPTSACRAIRRSSSSATPPP